MKTTHETRMAATRGTLRLAGYELTAGDDYEGPYYLATITRENEGPGYRIAFTRKTVTPADG